MRISTATPADVEALQPLRSALWPDSSLEDLRGPNAARCFDADFRIFLVHDDEHALIAFAEVALRHDYVHGCDHSPVAFVEGIYVAPAHRRLGIARALIEAAAEWGRARGAHELASDALIDNLASHAFHRAIGFEETERVVYFRRVLAGASA